MTTKWMGTPPTHCQLCELRLTTTFIDGRTHDGRWGIMCPRCRVVEGLLELGPGLGQKYQRTAGGPADRPWVKVAG